MGPSSPPTGRALSRCGCSVHKLTIGQCPPRRAGEGISYTCPSYMFMHLVMVCHGMVHMVQPLWAGLGLLAASSGLTSPHRICLLVSSSACAAWTDRARVAPRMKLKDKKSAKKFAVVWRVPNPPGANPLIAERAFPTSDYWGRTGVANRLLTPCHTRLRRPPRGPFGYQGYDSACLVKSPKPPEPRKYEKNTKKKKQNPPPRVGPQKYEKYENSHFRAIFVFFRYFFCIFRPHPGSGILYFFRSFFVFLGFRGFWALYQASGIVIAG